MTIAVLYCGGCNPEIDREGLVRRLADELGEEIQPLKKAGQTPDRILLVCGCVRGCLNSSLPDQWAERSIVVAGLTVDAWPVTEEEMVGLLAERLQRESSEEKTG